MSNRVPYRLALDLGTNSIGWCLLDLNGNGDPCGVRRMGVRIFPDGRDPKSKELLAADRRLARSMRRRRDRYLRRRSALMNALVAAGLMPADQAGRKALELEDPYELRARALTEPLAAGQVGRALFHLNQRRGFKSNRKAAGEENEAGKIKAGISALKAEIEASGETTLGAWLAARHRKRETVRARLDGAGAKASYEFYPERSLVHDEFQAIRTAQAPHHPDITAEQWDRVELVIFRQRPLKQVRPGKCTLFPDQERAPWALPVAQKFRILTEIGNLKLYRPGEEPRELSAGQHAQLFAKLCRSADLTFEKIRKELKLDPGLKVNLEGEKRDRLKGDAVTSALSAKKRFGPKWNALTPDDRRDIVGRLIEAEDEAELAGWLETVHGLPSENAAHTAASPGLPDGYCRLSEKALVELVPLMRERRLRYDEAVRALDLHHSDFRPDGLLDELPYYGEPLERFIAFGSGEPSDPPELRLGRFPNPTVHIGLNELRKLVNRIVERWGKPADIVVELARDLKRSRDERDTIQREQAQNQRKNEDRFAKIKELGIDPRPELDAASPPVGRTAEGRRRACLRLYRRTDRHQAPAGGRCGYRPYPAVQPDPERRRRQQDRLRPAGQPLQARPVAVGSLRGDRRRWIRLGGHRAAGGGVAEEQAMALPARRDGPVRGGAGLPGPPACRNPPSVQGGAAVSWQHR